MTSAAAPQADADLQELLQAKRYRDAFALLLPRYRNKVFRLTFSMLRNQALAEDVTQDIFLRIWRALPGYGAQASLSTWIYAISRNACLSELRKKRPTISLDDEDDYRPEVAALAAPDPKTAAHRQQWDDELQDWLDSDPQAAGTGPFAIHLRDCNLCPERLDQFQQLESTLRASTPSLSLDQAFDAQLLSRLQAVDLERQLAARRRIDEELLSGLTALSRSRRQTLTFVAPGMAAGGAVAFALATHFSAAGLSPAPLPHLVSQGAQVLTQGNPALLPSIVTALLGASIGGLIARWLAKSAS